MVLTTAYFPPVEYFACFAKCSALYIEAHETYQKQSYRNRCTILTANGPMNLNVPIVHNGFRLITEVNVDYATPWLERTEYAIDSAYYNSPFFEYYRDSLFALLDSRPDTLWELNMSITRFFVEKMGLKTELIPTAEYVGEDMVIHPKRPSEYSPRPYYQVFSEKFGFVPNLSVMDLLFNEGPESLSYIIF